MEDAWKRQKELKKKYNNEDVPDIGELVNIINSKIISKDDFKQKRNRALFAMYYLTGCRASEITKCNKLRRIHYEGTGKNRKSIGQFKDQHDFEGIKKSEITFDVVDGFDCMNVRTENRKNKNQTTKKQPIPISKEKEIVKYIIDYLVLLRDDDILFPFWHTRAAQIINKVGWNIHFIRHIRATHLVTKYDFNEQSLVKFMGWTDSRPAKHYMELSSKDIFRQFYK